MEMEFVLKCYFNIGLFCLSFVIMEVGGEYWCVSVHLCMVPHQGKWPPVATGTLHTLPLQTLVVSGLLTSRIHHHIKS